jgi:intracellular sulfur oxidation DsrE/DsrF family protein
VKGEDWTGLARARAVWDFTTGDPRRFQDRLSLLLHALKQFRHEGIEPDFVLLLHGPATKFAARTLVGTKFDPMEEPALAEGRALIGDALRAGVRIVVCRIAMERCGIGEDNLWPGVEVQQNVFANAIALQNRGYAYLPIG